MKKLYTYIIAIFIILSCILVFTTGCKKSISKDNNIKVASENLATEDIVETKELKLEDIREIPTTKKEEIKDNKKKEPSIFLFLFNRKEYQRLKNENSVVETEKKLETINKEETKAIIKETTKNVVSKATKSSYKKISTKSEISSNSIIKKEIEETKSAIEETIKEEIIKDNEKPIIKEEIVIKDNEDNKNIDYVEKVFKNENDKFNIKTFIKDINNREYDKVYNDVLNGKYKNTIDEFIKNYDGIFNDLKAEFNKKKYKDFNESIIKKWKEPEYANFKKDFEKITKKYNKETKEIENICKKLNFKTLLSNLNNGKYKNLINEIKELIFKEEYNDLREDFLNEFIDGEYTDLTYDFIYNFLDITYKYKINEPEEIKETTKVIEETIKEEIVENEKKIPPIILITALSILLLLTIIVFFIIKSRKFL